MKTRSLIFGVLAAGCALGIALPRPAAAVTDEEFKALQQQMQQQQQQIQDLQKGRQEDQQEIKRLKEQVGATQQTTAETQKKVEETQKKVEQTQQTATAAQEAAAKLQPLHAVPVAEGPLTLHNFTMVGDAEVQYVKSEGEHGSFLLADFAPIFLYRASDNVLFEAGFDVTLQNHDGGGADTAVDLSFAQLDYLFNDYVTVVGGLMVLPLGTYSERAAGWLNKIPDDPLPRDVVPGGGVGVQLRGALPVGQRGQMLTYSVYGVNGPGSLDGTGNSDQLDLDTNVGVRSDGASANLHSNPSAGGRIGWFFPWQPHYDVELGISGQAGEWDNAGKRLWSATVVDLAIHLSPYFEAKGEYINTWQETDDRGTINPRGWWVQAAYKLAGLNLDLPMINGAELVARYDTKSDALTTKIDRYTLGMVYYITNTLQFEGDYEFVTSNDPSQANNQLILQLSYGF